ncbi:hypothetical protein ACFP1Z_07010 [Streptomyces gamaensis]|uniref:Potassium-transporting ATPase n=1 Tax=Streptomyces gamaensis TaxID=1763542 RepID=A0ABW0YWE3_9ACTN
MSVPSRKCAFESTGVPPMADVVFIVLTFAVFGLLFLIVKGVERL